MKLLVKIVDKIVKFRQLYHYELKLPRCWNI